MLRCFERQRNVNDSFYGAKKKRAAASFSFSFRGASLGDRLRENKLTEDPIYFHNMQ
jgi:hypothetical protein